MVAKKIPIRYTTYQMRVFDLMNYYKTGKLELNPAFQRDSVWRATDRKKLIDSMLRGYPVPALVLYRREPPGQSVIFDVIDGKQRLESIFRFTGLLRGDQFAVTIDDDERSVRLTGEL